MSEVYENRLTEDRLLLVLREYHPFPRCALSDPAMVEKVTDVLCRILCPQKSPRPFSDTPETLARCRESWLSVLREHPGRFSLTALDGIGENIGEVNRRLFAPFLRFVHGDFHVENLLLDDEDNLLVCDWQNCGLGEAGGDPAFFLSRLSADGVSLSRQALLESYCRKAGISEPHRL